tara:strand:- start:173 stop:1102 length:930 start_codon:yes stop_codon:yes gene_type:complete
MFGEPTSISNTKHGFAFWKTRGLFDEHILRDEDVKHCVPRNHHDYFYSSIKFFIPEDKVFDVLKISGSINYDGLKNLITARCGGIGANYATLYLGMMVAMGKMTIKEVQSDDLYPKHISGEMKTYNEMKKEMMIMKRANREKFKKELKQDFAPYAFKKCYKEKSGGSRTKTSSKGTLRKKETKNGSKSKSKGTQKSKSSSKDKRVGKGLINTRNEDCGINDSTGCCPHMGPDEKGRYSATNEKTTLTYDNKKYELHTCCMMCADAMNALARTDPAKFKASYVSRYMPNGDMVAKNHHTKKEVQVLKLKK